VTEFLNILLATVLGIAVPVGVVALIVFHIGRAGRRHQQRANALASAASHLGLTYEPWDPFNLPFKFEGLKAFGRGIEERVYNVLHGQAGFGYVILCDYSYTVAEGKEKHTHYRSYGLLSTEMTFQHLELRPENFLDRVSALAGINDINFESEEFNRKYFVRSKDRKFAYDIINPKMIDYLLDRDGIYMELGGNVVLVHYRRQVPPEGFVDLYYTLRDIGAALPDFGDSHKRDEGLAQPEGRRGLSPSSR